MPESNEPPVAKPDADEGQWDPASTAQSQHQSSAPESLVPANFVQIIPILKPPSPEEEESTAEEMEEDTWHETDEPSLPRVEYRTPQAQPTAKKELSPLEITSAEFSKATNDQNAARLNELLPIYMQQFEEKQRAERAARALAEEAEREARALAADQEDVDEFAEEEQPGPEPDQFKVLKGGHPANTANLTDMDLIRRRGVIEKVRYASPENGIINQFTSRYELPWDLRPLYESLTLPAGIEGYGTARDLFNGISALLHKHVMFPSKDCSLLAYWALATWFAEAFPSFPCVVISGPAAIADSLLRTLAAVCRRPILLGELSLAIFRKLPINAIRPTLLIREPQLNRYLSLLLNSSNQRGYLFYSGKAFQELYCPKCIYVGEYFKGPLRMSNSVHIHLSESRSGPDYFEPTEDVTTPLQNRLLAYRLLNYNSVNTPDFYAPGFQRETTLVADVLSAGIVDDVDLQKEILEALKGRDEQARVDRATGLDGLIVRAVLFHCHQNDQQKFVHEIAATTNRLYAEDGEPLRVSNEKVGIVLKQLGLNSHRLGNAGRGLMFDKVTQSQAHRLGHDYDVLTAQRTCTYCHEVQRPQSEEVVQGVQGV